MEGGRCLLLVLLARWESQVIPICRGNVRDATSQRGEKMSRSAKGAVGSRDLAVRTQKMEGSI